MGANSRGEAVEERVETAGVNNSFEKVDDHGQQLERYKVNDLLTWNGSKNTNYLLLVPFLIFLLLIFLLVLVTYWSIECGKSDVLGFLRQTIKSFVASSWVSWNTYSWMHESCYEMSKY